jgi:methylase of polypeptide subunit release factors
MQNVYLEKWKRIVEERSYGYSSERDSLVKKYSWAIPDTKALGSIVSLGKPIIEMGCGTGYWARLLHDKGADIIAYDINPPRQESNQFGHETIHPCP